MSTFEIAYEQAGMYQEALKEARDAWGVAEGVNLRQLANSRNEPTATRFKDSARHARYMADSLTLEIERLDAYLKEHKPKGKKGKRK